MAHGLRNPFRFTTRPGTSEIWVGDVGFGTWEEINRIVNPTDGVVENFGWPCYEGGDRQGGYDGANLEHVRAPVRRGQRGGAAPLHLRPQRARWCRARPARWAARPSRRWPSTRATSSRPKYRGALFFGDYARAVRLGHVAGRRRHARSHADRDLRHGRGRPGRPADGARTATSITSTTGRARSGASATCCPGRWPPPRRCPARRRWWSTSTAAPRSGRCPATP